MSSVFLPFQAALVGAMVIMIILVSLVIGGLPASTRRQAPGARLWLCGVGG